MRKHFTLTLLLFTLSPLVNGQTGPENFKEGFLLRRLELASSFAVSELKANHKSISKSEFLDVSYENDNKEIETLILRGLESPELLVRFKFDSLPKPTPLLTSTTELKLSSFETKLIELFVDATTKIQSQYEGNFTPTNGTDFRAIPLQTDELKKVIVYSKPKKRLNYVFLGNDYELLYDSTGGFESIKKFHSRTTNIPLISSQGMVTVHEHSTSDEISSTDVCSLLLNKDRIRWKQHIVLNPEYVSVFMIDREEYILMMREEFDEQMKKQRDGR